MFNTKNPREMKSFYFLVDEVLPNLTYVSSIVANKSPLPILDSVYITIHDDKATLMASDSVSWLKLSCRMINAGDEKDYSFCVNAKDLLSSLRVLGGRQVDMLLNEDKKVVECKHKSGTFTLPYESAEDYPQPKIEWQEEGKFSQATLAAIPLAQAIGKVEYAIANDPIRPIMCGVYLDFVGYDLICVASDGRKLMRYTMEKALVNCEPLNVGFILAQKPAHIVTTLLSNMIEGSVVELGFDERTSVIKTSTFSLVTRLVEGKYPNYNAVIPQNQPICYKTSKGELIDALKRVIPLGNSNIQLVVMEFDGKGKLVLSSENLDFSKSAKEELDNVQNMTEESSQGLRIGFQSEMLMQTIQNVPTEEIELLFIGQDRAGSFLPVYGEEEKDKALAYTAILMPLMI